MENASKALIMAGAVLIAVMLISLFIYVFSAIGEFNSQTQAQQQSNQVIATNRFFVESAYDVNPTKAGVQIYGYDAYNVIRKARDVNNNANSPVTITIEIPYSENNFDAGADGILTDVEKARMNKQFTYSYGMDIEGYINRITISEV